MKRILSRFFTVLMIFSALSSCQLDTSVDSSEPKTDTATLNPKPYESRSENLDFIYDPDILGETTITISRKEWQKMLFFYDKNDRNEQYVVASKYNFTKGSNTWEMNNVGIRVRGNTSRRRPQTDGYEGYRNNYVQSHFKIDFEEFLESNQSQKMAGCMKSLLLKHFKGDPTYTREVYGYNLFRQNGIWISPRASFTRLTIKIVDSDGTAENVNYGVYAMIESIDKQFLKARKTKEEGTFESDEGNLWKCTNWAPMQDNPTSIGTETGGDFYNVKTLSPDPFRWTADYNEKYTPDYDLKTNKKTVSTATSQFKSFISQLNKLSDESAIKTWAEKNFDVDLFLRTYAINVILGMWDDYWVNGNNYYFYFDTNGKAYFIPYDYDNILGCNMWTDWDSGTQNPLYWGWMDGSRPLIEKILSVDEYKKRYQNYLIDYSKYGSHFYYTESQERLNKWKTMVEPYIASDQIEWIAESYGEWGDYFADWGYKSTQYKLFSGDDKTNFFKAKTNAIAKYCTYTYQSGEAFSITYMDESGKNILLKVDNITSKVNVYDTFTENGGNITFDENTDYLYWKDSNGKTIYEANQDITLYPSIEKYLLVNFYNNDTISGYFKLKQDFYIPYLYEFDMIETPEAPDGCVFAGWYDSEGKFIEDYKTLTKNTDFYAKFSILPIRKDGDVYKFYFVPSDFTNAEEYNGSQTMTIRGEFSGWGQEEMTWDSENNYYYYECSNAESGQHYKFYAPDTDSWFGGNEYIPAISENYIQQDGNKNFIVVD